MLQNHNIEETAESSDVGDGTGLSRFSHLLRKRAAERGAWAQANEVSCYRVYDNEVFPYEVAIDVYKSADGFEEQTFLVISQYRSSDDADELAEDRLFDEAVEAASCVLGVSQEHIFEKARHHDRSGNQYKDGQREAYIITTQESGYLLEVDLEGHLDTGIFLDHRPVRELIGQMAKGMRFLNLFAYTGTATVHAVGAGAAATTTVDLSQTYLDWAKRNMQLNDLAGDQHHFVRSDAMHWLDRDIRKGVTYDLVFVDPPTFSRSKLKGKKTWSVARDHVELLTKVTAVLSSEGKAIFSCNLRDFKPDFHALEQAGIKLTNITAQTIPADFAQNPQIHQCYLVERQRNA